jgi:hypothetical protein
VALVAGGTARADFRYQFVTRTPAPQAGPVAGALFATDEQVATGLLIISSYGFALLDPLPPFERTAFDPSSGPGPSIFPPDTNIFVNPSTGDFLFGGTFISLHDTARTNQYLAIELSPMALDSIYQVTGPEGFPLKSGTGHWVITRVSGAVIVPAPGSALLVGVAGLCGVASAAGRARAREKAGGSGCS